MFRVQKRPFSFLTPSTGPILKAVSGHLIPPSNVNPYIKGGIKCPETATKTGPMLGVNKDKGYCWTLKMEFPGFPDFGLCKGADSQFYIFCSCLLVKAGETSRLFIPSCPGSHPVAFPQWATQGFESLFACLALAGFSSTDPPGMSHRQSFPDYSVHGFWWVPQWVMRWVGSCMMGHAMGEVMCVKGHRMGGVMCSWVITWVYGVTHLIMGPPILGRAPYVQTLCRIMAGRGGSIPALLCFACSNAWLWQYACALHA